MGNIYQKFCLILTIGLCCLSSPAWAKQKLSKQEAAAQKQAFVEGFVWSNIYATFLHELAHFLIASYQIPIFGEEEDAADNFIVVAGAALLNAEELRSLVNSTSYYYINMAMEADNSGAFSYPYRTGYNRFYQLNCLYVGMNPQNTSVALEYVDFSQEDMETCQGVYEAASEAWLGAVPTIGEAANDEPWLFFQEFTTDNPILLTMQKNLKLATQDFNQNLGIEGYVGVGFKECSEDDASSDAFYSWEDSGSSPSDTITFCTQYVEDMKDLAERVYEGEFS